MQYLKTEAMGRTSRTSFSTRAVSDLRFFISRARSCCRPSVLHERLFFSSLLLPHQEHSQNKTDRSAETTKQSAKRMSATRQYDCVSLKHAARYLVDRSQVLLQYDFKDKNTSTNQSLCTAIWRRRLEPHTVKSEPTLQELDSAERGRSVVLNKGEKKSSWTMLQKQIHGSGNSNERWNPKQQFYVEFFNGSFGSRTLERNTLKQYFWMQERGEDGDLNIERVPTTKN